MKYTFTALIVFTFLLNACYYDKGDKLYPDFKCDSTNVTYNSDIKQIFDQNCIGSGCHSGQFPAVGIDLSAYNTTTVFVQDTFEQTRLFNSIRFITGGSKNMPQGRTKLSDCDIDKIEAWVRRGYPEN